MRTRLLLLAAVLLTLTACSGTSAHPRSPTVVEQRAKRAESRDHTTPSHTVVEQRAKRADSRDHTTPSHTVVEQRAKRAESRDHTTPTPSPIPTERPDPRWRFFTSDHHSYASPWYAGSHRIMIGFGCNASPWYDHDPRCPGQQGFHHGIDVTMPCGTLLRSGVAGEVLPPSAPGSPGPAYGVHPFRIRTGAVDVLIGHTRTVFVHPGQQVHRGQRIALSSDSGAPDGCHLHFEVRPHGGGVATAEDPSPWLALRRRDDAARR